MIPFLLVAGCGDDDGSGGGGARRRRRRTGGGRGREGHRSRRRWRAPRARSRSAPARTRPAPRRPASRQFNAQNPGITVKLLEFPESADEQRNQFVTRQEAKSAECDVFYSDVIWTAEFAIQKWLYDMTPYVEPRRDEFIESTLATATYEGKIWGVPHKTNAGFLYYRTDQVDAAPEDLAGGLREGRRERRHRLPGRRLRGPHGRLPRAGVRGRRQDPVRGRQDRRDRLAGEPRGAQVHGRRHQGRRGAEGGHDVHGGAGPPRVRGRPGHVPAQLAVRRTPPPTAPKATKGKFKVVPFPAFEGGGKAGILGGANLVISTYSKNPGARAEVHRLHDARGAPGGGHREVLRRVAARGGLRRPGGAEGAAVLGRAQDGGRAEPVAAGLAGLSADLAGDLQERQPGALGADEPRGRAQERADARCEQALETF